MTNHNKIAVASMMRDNMVWHNIRIDQVHRYFKQINSQAINADLQFFILENNSVDDTFEVLTEYAKKQENIHLIKVHIDKPYKIASNTSKERLAYLSNIGNILLNEIRNYNKFDYVFWIESDLIVNNSSLIGNLAHDFLITDNPVIISPMVLQSTFNKFHDIFCFRYKNGKNWSPNEHIIVRNTTDRFIEMSSIGSCALIRFDIIKKCNFGNNCFIELCKQASKYGKIYVDTHLEVYHPSAHGIAERWV